MGWGVGGEVEEIGFGDIRLLRGMGLKEKERVGWKEKRVEEGLFCLRGFRLGGCFR